MSFVTKATSRDFPTTADALDSAHNGEPDFFVTKLNPCVRRRSFTPLSSGAVLPLMAQAVYVTGFTRSDFPTTVGVFDTTHNGGPDAFVTKFGEVLASTPGCEITTGRWILSYVDHGRAQRLNMHSLSIQTIVCNGSSAIFGQTTISGSDAINFQINVAGFREG